MWEDRDIWIADKAMGANEIYRGEGVGGPGKSPRDTDMRGERISPVPRARRSKEIAG